VASLTVRNIPEDAKLRFRQVAAGYGRSMEDHLRQLILNADVDDKPAVAGVSDMTHSFRHYEPDQRTKSRARIERLIALGRGLNFEAPAREHEDIDILEL
jgi:plasmid stability protein